MRPAGLALVVFWAAAPAAVAQPSPADRVPTPGAADGGPVGRPVARPAAAPAAVDPAVKAHLDGWQKAMADATNFYADCTKTYTHRLTNKTSVYAGRIYCLKPSLARVHIHKKPADGEKADANEFMVWVCTGKAVFEYDGAVKVVTEYPLGGGAGDNILLAFMSGRLSADDVAARFDLKLAKEDDHYVYLDARPRWARDLEEFEAVTLVLFRPTVPRVGYLPRTVVLRKAGGQVEEVWEFPQPMTNAPTIRPEHFRPEPPPKGWKVQQVQAGPPAPPAQPPRVARPAAPN